MSLIREIKDIKRFFNLTEKERQVVFYSEHDGYFPNFEGALHELTISHGVVVDYITSNAADETYCNPPKNVRVYYVNKLLFALMLFVKHRVMVMTMPDLDLFHIKRSTNPVHYVYMFHSLVSTHMVYNNGAFDHYDSLLCTGDYQMTEIRSEEERRHLKPKDLIEGGYYRLERIHRRYQDYQQGRSPNEKPVVLVAPSWGEQNILAQCGPSLIRSLLAKDFEVILRPHPESFRRASAIITDLEKAFSSSPNFILERSIKTDDSLMKADVLVSDCSGITLEYAFGTERPVLYIDVPAKIRNNDYEAIGKESIELSLRSQLGQILSVDQIENAGDTVTGLLCQKQDYKDRVRHLRQEYVYHFGNSASIAAHHILQKANLTEQTNSSKATPALKGV